MVKAEVMAASETLGPDGVILSPADNFREDTSQAMHNVKIVIDKCKNQIKQVV